MCEFDCTPGAIPSESWTGWSGQFRYTRQQRWARPGEHTSAGLCIGAAGAAAAAELQAAHQRLQYKTVDVVRRHRWRTGAGGVTGYTWAAPVGDWRRRAAAPVEDRSRRTSREPAAGVMDRYNFKYALLISSLLVLILITINFFFELLIFG
jgi:hypothetical protein